MVNDTANANLSREEARVRKHHSVGRYYYLVGFVVFAVSLFIHSPCEFCPKEYSDVYSLFFQVLSYSDRWFGAVKDFGIPYIDYRFEYPPVIAVIFYLTTAISPGLAQWTGLARESAFYHIIALIFLLPSYILYLKAIKKTSKLIGTGRARLILAGAGIAIAYYVVYNFDIIAIALAVLSLLLLIRGRTISAGFLLGLSVASKIVTGIIVFPSLLYLTRKGSRTSARFLLSFLLTVVGSFLPIYLFAPVGFLEMIKWHATWYCENCFYVMIATDLADSTWRVASLVLMMLWPLAVMLTVKNVDDKKVLLYRSLLMIPAVISVSYVYSPQMNVMIAPAYLLPSSVPAVAALLLSDLLNLMIMVFFFRSEIVCGALNMQSCPPVWGRESPIQWIAFSRIVLLWLFILLAIVGVRTRGLKLTINGRKDSGWQEDERPVLERSRRS